MCNELLHCDRENIIKFLIKNKYSQNSLEILRKLIKCCHPDKNDNTDNELFGIILEFYNNAKKRSVNTSVKKVNFELKNILEFRYKEIVTLSYNNIVELLNFPSASAVQTQNKFLLFHKCVVFVKDSPEERIECISGNLYIYVPRVLGENNKKT